ncbi:P63C domain-containing protein [Flavobacteriaceae bacterium MAR_2010_188]|nr:P63C domain-containing protein [Flavobacteriaceae bacterium MAR_2010_188]
MESKSIKYQNLRDCGVKIIATIKGVTDVTGSGILYLNRNDVEYDYVITAKHILQESSKTQYKASVISKIEIQHPIEKRFELLAEIKKNQISQRVIAFDEDFAIIKIEKNQKHQFPPILVSDEPDIEDEDFYVWGTYAANYEQIHKVDFKKNDEISRRYQTKVYFEPYLMKGISGAALFSANKPCIYGIIRGFESEKMTNQTLDLVEISFTSINKKLQSLNLVPMDTEESKSKKILSKRVIDLYQAVINGMVLNIEQARRRLRTDLFDDWFHDPLMYVDLLSKEYLFSQFEDDFYTELYKPEKWNLFYVPKKRLSHRKAYVGSFKDRIIYMAMVGSLADKLDQAMISQTYSARYNKYSSDQLILNGVEQWKKLNHQLNLEANARLSTTKFKHNCLIEVDILNFYDNVDISLLATKIRRVCKTSNDFNVTDQLKNFLIRISGQNTGLPQNSDASSLLATFYINQVDVFMSNHCTSYYRFMDDIKIFCKNKYEARNLLQLLEFELKRCGLSINAQKTKIFELTDNGTSNDNMVNRKTYFKQFNLELLKLKRLLNSDDSNYRNEAFHLTIQLLNRLFQQEDPLSEIESSRELNYLLSTLKKLVIKDIRVANDKFIEMINKSIYLLHDSPWLTYQVCSILSLLSSEMVHNEFLPDLIPLVLDSRFNIFAYQNYQVWLLLAHHKCDVENLREFAIDQIERNDQTNEAGIAAMIIYMCSVDPHYHRIINRKFTEGKYQHSYFQARLSLIAQRTLEISSIPVDKIHSTLKKAPTFTNSFKDKELVLSPRDFYRSEDTINDQLYSL